MPESPYRGCATRGCAGLTRERYCPDCKPVAQRNYDRRRGSSSHRGYGAAWRRLRLRVLARQDYICCETDCNAEATEVDHIIPKSRGGTDDLENLQGLCKPHHSRKTVQDGRWG